MSSTTLASIEGSTGAENYLGRGKWNGLAVFPRVPFKWAVLLPVGRATYVSRSCTLCVEIKVVPRVDHERSLHWSKAPSCKTMNTHTF